MQTDLTRDKLAGLWTKRHLSLQQSGAYLKAYRKGKYGSQIVIKLLYSHYLHLISVI